MKVTISLDHPAEQILGDQMQRLGMTPSQVIGRALTLYSIAQAVATPPSKSPVLWRREWEEVE